MMKNLLLIVVLLATTSSVFAQFKKSKEIDALTLQNKELTGKLDTANMAIAKYTVMYNVLKDSVIKYQFDPEKTAFLLDSLKTSRGTAAVLLTDTSTLPNDSIKILVQQNLELTAKIDSIKTAWNAEKNAGPFIPVEELENAKAITGLKQLKELLDQKIITDAEFLTLKKKYVDKL